MKKTESWMNHKMEIGLQIWMTESQMEMMLIVVELQKLEIFSTDRACFQRFFKKKSCKIVDFRSRGCDFQF